ncbi:MAG TPA: hypothetical protein PKZ27_02980 [Rhodocyclaceae bacterium]|nr:hypothetical protein [Burkholderiaceae bacterium]HRP74530.1 hypothetical protein [Rhodocyclaceae bacterium]
MIILTYRPKPVPSISTTPVPFMVERFTDEAAVAARSKAIQMARDGATDVYLSRAYEHFWLAPSVESEDVK